MARFSSSYAGAAWSFLLLGSCEDVEDRCASFPTSYERLNTNLNALPNVPRGAAPASALQTIGQCYQRHPYASLTNPIAFEGAKSLGEEKTLLIYEIEGVMDVSLVFQVDAAGTVLRAFQYSWFDGGPPRVAMQ